MNHNDAVDIFRACPCGCHKGTPGACWCRDVSVPDPFEISHNDRVEYFGGCQCSRVACRWQRTDPEIARLLADLGERQRHERLRAGRPRTSDIAHLARNPHRYPGVFR